MRVVTMTLTSGASRTSRAMSEARVDDLLEVVEHEQDLALAQVVDHRVHGRRRRRRRSSPSVEAMAEPTSAPSLIESRPTK